MLKHATSGDTGRKKGSISVCFSHTFLSYHKGLVVGSEEPLTCEGLGKCDLTGF